MDAAPADRLPGGEGRSATSASASITSTCAAAAARGIPVGNTPGILDGATADLAFALLLAAGRRLVEGDRYARGPDFLRYDPSYMLGREVHGSTLGIIGMGRIGEQVAQRARGFDMTVLYHNRRPPAGGRGGARACGTSTQDELLAASDYVVLTVPLTPETRGLIGRAELAKMKPTAMLVNVARGAVVDTDALTEALAARHDLRRGAGRDRPGAAAARPPAAEAGQRHHHAAPGQRDGGDAAADGGGVGREPAGGAGGVGRCVAGWPGGSGRGSCRAVCRSLAPRVERPLRQLRVVARSPDHWYLHRDWLSGVLCGKEVTA